MSFFSETKRKVIKSFWIVLCSIVMMNTSHATSTQPKYTIIPNTPTVIHFSSLDAAFVRFTVTNKTKVLRELLMTPFPFSGIQQVTGGLRICDHVQVLGAGESCQLVLWLNGSEFTMGSVNMPVVICKKSIDSNSPDPFLCSQTSESSKLNITRLDLARITVTPIEMNLVAAGAAQQFTVTNQSPTATANNIQLHLERTALAGNVTQTSTCDSVGPGGSCTITVTPGTTAYSSTLVPIRGANTNPIPVDISVTSPGISEISVTDGSPLILQTSGSPGRIRIKNNGDSIATDIQATLPASMSSVTQDATACDNLAVGAECDLFFTPGTVPITSTAVDISGTNTTTTSANIEVDAASEATLAITSGSPLSLKANGSTTGSMVIQNQSTTTTVSFYADFTNTALNGAVTATGCPDIGPGASCTMVFTPSTKVVSLTDFSITGTSAQAVVGQISLVPYVAYITDIESENTPIAICPIDSSGSLNTSSCFNKSGTELGVVDPRGVAVNSSVTMLYVTGFNSSRNELVVGSCPINNLETGDVGSCSLYSGTAIGVGFNGVVYNPVLNVVYTTTPDDTVYKCSLNSSGVITSCALTTATTLNTPQQPAITAGGDYIFVANYDGDLLSQCTIGSDGSLSTCTTFTPISGSVKNIGVAVNTTDTFLYGTTQVPNVVFWCPLSDGTLSACSQFDMGDYAPRGVAMSSATNYIYACASGSFDLQPMIRKCVVNASSGAVTSCSNAGVPSSMERPGDIALLPTAY
ncbi:MAG: hypothetical protein NXI01_04260 [Gammaproteobacteria bacterium]|nr:hypothetical protein [Gammaproteobacteria bacterium]